MARTNRGSLWSDKKDGTLYARITFTDETGKRRDRKRKVRTGTKREAWNIVGDLLRELEGGGEQTLDAARMTFQQLADYHRDHYYVEPVYDTEGHKKSGLRSWKDYRNRLAVIAQKFGRRKLRSITYNEIKKWRDARLATPTERDVKRHEAALLTNPKAEITCTRAIASVNRELVVFKGVMNTAYQNRWILRNPFDDGPSLLDIANEHARERIATDEEEELLLAAIDEEDCYFKAFLITAFDTGMRASELFRLTPDSVDLKSRSILAVSYKGKKRRERICVMTERVEAELKGIIEGRTFAPGETVFKYKTFRRAFDAAKEKAGLDGFRFHDVRHTTATRLVSGNLPLGQVGKILGHTTPMTTWRYVHTDRDAQEQAASILNQRTRKGKKG